MQSWSSLPSSTGVAELEIELPIPIGLPVSMDNEFDKDSYSGHLLSGDTFMLMWRTAQEISASIVPSFPPKPGVDAPIMHTGVMFQFRNDDEVDLTELSPMNGRLCVLVAGEVRILDFVPMPETNMKQ